MNRHLVVVELDARLFATADETAGYIERAVAVALQRDAPNMVAGRVDLRPAITCLGHDRPIRFIDGAGLEDADLGRPGDLRVWSTGELVAELAERAQLGDTDRGLNWRGVVDISS